MPLPPSPQRVLWCLIGTAFCVVALAASQATNPRSAAAGVTSARQQVASSRTEVAHARAERVRLIRERRALEHRRAQLWHEVSARLDSMYRTGGGGGLRAVLASGDSLAETIDAAAMVHQIAEHDRRALHRWGVMTERSQMLEEQVVAAGLRIRNAERALQQSRAALVREVHRQRAARRRAALLARRAETPLVSPSIAPQTISREQESDSHEPDASAPGYSETGTASVYSDEFAGDPTASGEPYDPAAMTAAHRTLPLGTWIRVQGPAASAMIRINDRGPFTGGRILDLSRAAAAAVGVNGIGTVTITVQH